MFTSNDILDQLLSTQSLSKWNCLWDLYVSSNTTHPHTTTHSNPHITNRLSKIKLSPITIPLHSSHAAQINYTWDPCLTSPISSNPEIQHFIVPDMPPTAFKKVFANGREYFECTVNGCQKKFTRKAENAKSHWLLHNNLQPFVCKVCGKGYRRKHDLHRHLCNDSLQNIASNSTRAGLKT